MWPFSNIKRWIIKSAITNWLKEAKMPNFLAGKKSYIVAIAQIVMAVWITLAASPDPTLAFVPDAPTWLIAVLGALGIWTRKVAKP